MMASASSAIPGNLPALKLDAHGHRRVDLRAVIALALPLFINSSIQALLNLTDTWFLGRLSVEATAAVGATYWFMIVAMLALGGPGLAQIDPPVAMSIEFQGGEVAGYRG